MPSATVPGRRSGRRCWGRRRKRPTRSRCPHGAGGEAERLAAGVDRDVADRGGAERRAGDAAAAGVDDVEAGDLLFGARSAPVPDARGSGSRPAAGGSPSVKPCDDERAAGADQVLVASSRLSASVAVTAAQVDVVARVVASTSPPLVEVADAAIVERIVLGAGSPPTAALLSMNHTRPSTLIVTVAVSGEVVGVAGDAVEAVVARSCR